MLWSEAGQLEAFSAAQQHSTMPLAALRAAGLKPRLLSPTQLGYVYQIPKLLEAAEASALFQELTSGGHAWKTETDAFGPQQRESFYCGDERAIFSYVGLLLTPRSWPDGRMTSARHAVQTVAAAHGTQCTACLANHYAEGTGSIPWHHDEVRAHGPAKLVIALSLGGTRRMELRQRHAPSQPPLSLTLPEGSAVVMAGDAQEHWEHRLPLDEDAAPRRISLTFRSIEPGYEEGRAPPLMNS